MFAAMFILLVGALVAIAVFEQMGAPTGDRRAEVYMANQRAIRQQHGRQGDALPA